MICNIHNNRTIFCIHSKYKLKSNLTNQCTRIANARFYTGYMLAKKWVIGASFADPQSRDFKRWVDSAGYVPKNRAIFHTAWVGANTHAMCEIALFSLGLNKDIDTPDFLRLASDHQINLLLTKTILLSKILIFYFGNFWRLILIHTNINPDNISIGEGGIESQIHGPCIDDV